MTETLPLADVAEINPASPIKLSGDDLCSFLPMESVDDVSGIITRLGYRPFRDVAKGYSVFAENDVLLAKITPCMENGKCAVARRLRNGVGFGSTEFHVVRASPRVLPEWIYYYWRYPKTRLLAKRNMTGTAGQKRVPGNFLQDLRLPVPSIAEQKETIQRLRRADNLTRTRRYALQLCDEFLPAAFLEMFGNPRTRAFDTSELRDVVDPDRGVTYGIVQAGPHVSDGIPYIRTGDILDGVIATDGLLRTSREIAESYKRSEVKCGDLIISIRATVGTIAVLPQNLHGANLTQGTARIAPGSSVEKLFLLWQIRMPEAQRWIKQQVKGSTFLEITLARLREMPVFVPPLPLQHRFAVLVEKHDRFRAARVEALRQADHLFQTLLHDAFAQ